MRCSVKHEYFHEFGIGMVENLPGGFFSQSVEKKTENSELRTYTDTSPDPYVIS